MFTLSVRDVVRSSLVVSSDEHVYGLVGARQPGGARGAEQRAGARQIILAV